MSIDKKLINRIWSHVVVHPETGCWEWQGSTHNRSGHGRIRVGSAASGGKMQYVHRVMYELFKGSIPELEVVRHKCHNPKCCRPAHLELGSILDNNHDRLHIGGYAQELDSTAVVDIRIAYWKGHDVPRIAWDFSISRATVYDVLKGRTWKHVQ
jgi:hypothetical protein